VKTARGDTVYQEVVEAVPTPKIRTYFENHWEDPANPAGAPRAANVGEWFNMVGRLTDEYANPMAKRTVALHVKQPDGLEFDYHGNVCDDNGVVRRGVHLTQVGVWEAYYWFGGDEKYEGCEAEAEVVQ